MLCAYIPRVRSPRGGAAVLPRGKENSQHAQTDGRGCEGGDTRTPTDNLIATARARARLPPSQLAEEIPYTGKEAGLGFHTVVIGTLRWGQRSRGIGHGLHRRRIYMAAKNHRGAHANFADQKDCFRAGICRRRRRTRIKAEWRHEYGIDRFLSRSRGNTDTGFLWLGRQGMAEGTDLSSRKRTGPLHAGSGKIARARGSVAPK
jgi:hypothetical protein